MKSFESINPAYDSTFHPEQLSIGLVAPVENHGNHSVPSLERHWERVVLAEELGFKALWVRDIPFQLPSFGDAGQTFDPFTYLGFLAAKTKRIALGTGSIALPLHHPVHVAKSAATIDQLSQGRLLLGVASGDRPQEYPGMGIEFENRGEQFRESFQYIQQAATDFPKLDSKHYGQTHGDMDILPKPWAKKIPMLLTGYSQQELLWNAQHADGWMYYPRNLQQQEMIIQRWRELVLVHQQMDRPFLQPLYVDLHPQDDWKPQPIHLGFRIGASYLVEYLEYLRQIGVNHLIMNLRFNQAAIEPTLEKLANKVLPTFHTSTKTSQNAVS